MIPHCSPVHPGNMSFPTTNCVVGVRATVPHLRFSKRAFDTRPLVRGAMRSLVVADAHPRLSLSRRPNSVGLPWTRSTLIFPSSAARDETNVTSHGLPRRTRQPRGFSCRLDSATATRRMFTLSSVVPTGGGMLSICLSGSVPAIPSSTHSDLLFMRQTLRSVCLPLETGAIGRRSTR